MNLRPPSKYDPRVLLQTCTADSSYPVECHHRTQQDKEPLHDKTSGMDTVHYPQGQRRRAAHHNNLHEAVLSDSIESVVSVLARPSVDLDQRGQMGVTPLFIAATRGQSEIARILLNQGANVSAVSEYGLSALALAAHEGHLGVTRVLIEAGAHLEVTSLDIMGSTPLHLAAEGGHSEVIAALIEANANPDSRRNDGSTPIYLAARGGHPYAVRALLCGKADPLVYWFHGRGRPRHRTFRWTRRRGKGIRKSYASFFSGSRLQDVVVKAVGRLPSVPRSVLSRWMLWIFWQKLESTQAKLW